MVFITAVRGLTALEAQQLKTISAPFDVVIIDLEQSSPVSDMTWSDATVPAIVHAIQCVNYISVINNELKPPSGFSTAEDVDAAMQALSLGEITITNNIAIKSAMQLAFWSVLNGGGPFGTVIVKSGNLVSYGANHVVRHSDPTDHGEVNALRRAISNSKGQDLDGATLFTSTYPVRCVVAWPLILGLRTIVYCNTEADADIMAVLMTRCFGKK